MELMIKAINFLSSYPDWVKVIVPLMSATVVIILVLAPHNAKDKGSQSAPSGMRMSGNHQPDQTSGHQQTNQINKANNVYIYQQNAAPEEKDNLVISIPKAISMDIDRLVAEVVLINKGGRDATIEHMSCSYDAGETNVVKMWSQDNLEVIPAHSTRPKRFEIADAFIDNVRKLNPKKIPLLILACKVIDSDGNSHTTEVNLGILSVSGNGWQFTSKESKTIQILPSEYFQRL